MCPVFECGLCTEKSKSGRRAPVCELLLYRKKELSDSE